ncbi:hypothetical protein [Sulfurovum sp. TSL1]|uniref:hypothetical protein n=1 Tax=Sulfurovum sp. TSL1 TaxID=2826994 RepID=UPI001CC3508C|nr:hypothetical protein [Sulfurovum sp. TSL1]GIT98721.1 hypothetical protein TSL1_15420 [Sulfurovum sp. TSL1]
MLKGLALGVITGPVVMAVGYTFPEQSMNPVLANVDGFSEGGAFLTSMGISYEY